MRSKLRAWRSLTAEDRTSLARAWSYLLVAKAALTLLPLPKVEAVLACLPRGSRRGTLPTDRLVDLLDVAARHHVSAMTCLPRSLTLKTLLRQQGIAADLRIGVRRHADRLFAHAWVEQEGAPVGEPKDIGHRFQPLAAAQALA
jgi:hypothetical protein